MDQNKFAQMIQALLGNDNDLRKAAENEFTTMKNQNPEAVAGLLCVALGNVAGEKGPKEQCAVLLRQVLRDPTEQGSCWSKIQPGTQAQIKDGLFSLIAAEPDKSTRRKIGDCVVALSSLCKAPEGASPDAGIAVWPSLFDGCRILIEKLAGGDTDSASVGLYVLCQLAAELGEGILANGDLKGWLANMLGVVLQCQASAEVRMYAVKLVCSLVRDTEKRWKELQGIAATIVQVSAEMVAQDEDNALKCLQELEEVANPDGQPLFFKPCLPMLFSAMFQVGTADAVGEDARQAAIEVVITLCEGKPKMCSSQPNFLQQIVDCAMKFVMKLQDEPSWANDLDEDDDDEEELHDYGREVLDRVAKAIEDKEVVFEVILRNIEACLSAPTWQGKNAALATIQQTVEYLEDTDNIRKCVAIVMRMIEATEHPRLRFTAWSAVAAISEDHQPWFMEEFHAEMLPLFLKGFQDPAPRVAVHCMEAFTHFAEEVDEVNMEPWVDPLMNQLNTMLTAAHKNGSRPVMRRTITAIAVIAGLAKKGFSKYYDVLVPALTQVISLTANDAKERQLLGKCFECFSLLANTVAKERFYKDAVPVLDAMLVAAAQPKEGEDDPIVEYCLSAAQRICQALKETFKPFVQKFLPLIFEKIKATPRELDGTVDVEDMTCTMVLDDSRTQAKFVGIKTAELEDIQHCLDCLHTFTMELKEHYVDFIQVTAPAVLPIFTFRMDTDCIDFAFLIWSEMVKGARIAGNTPLLAELLGTFLSTGGPGIANVLNLAAQSSRAEDTDETDLIYSYVTGIKCVVEETGPNVLSQQQVQEITTLCITLMNHSWQREAELDKRDKEDDDDDAAVEEEDAKGSEQSVRTVCNDAIGSIMKHHADLFVAVGKPMYFPIVQSLLQAGSNDEPKLLLGLYAIDEMVEHLGDRFVPDWPAVMPIVFEQLKASSADVRQAACYAVGCAAKCQAFGNAVGQVLPTLQLIIDQTRAQKKKRNAQAKANDRAADNALSALLQIVIHHPQSLPDVQSVWVYLLDRLPLREDEEESVKVNKELVTLVRKEDGNCLGPNRSNLPKLMAFCAEAWDSRLSDQETRDDIVKLFKAVPESIISGFAQMFSDKQKKRINKIMSE
mmetsp:Transcript_20916/g.45998  ORF Transcript_20916/g.45998 Transcript_20916/m.45998 type:complete len:1121 (+) Transcript_20916:89-3451(+)|eukprot:CAMPEP_0204256354 /NCGR_PEP_ID=MMETSP0468-20130131/3727_1 /ASSEMBLY_ACC=CAM_ASM_000383 /TAXON_ID=2969 /ORGANISM="Oxyrrhis marina" /LENGTH=1120 /DNA_ID=CAMNT_0051230305 /DNA_START=65 /DNA_END=3427 /DNA_ORIENTATION=+